MPLFRCFILGENFPGWLFGQVEPIGFYTTRYVMAESPAQAEHLALALLQADETLRVPESEQSPQARVFFEEIEQVPDETEQAPNQGFSFFMMGG